MPELPDVVVYIDRLLPRVVGQELGAVRLKSPFLLRSVTPPISDAEGKRVVESGILDDVRITADTQTNSLIVTAPEENLELLKALIERLDQPNSASQIKTNPDISNDSQK